MAHLVSGKLLLFGAHFLFDKLLHPLGVRFVLLVLSDLVSKGSKAALNPRAAKARRYEYLPTELMFHQRLQVWPGDILSDKGQ